MKNWNVVASLKWLLLIAAIVTMAGCATVGGIFAGASTPADKADRILSLVAGGVDAVDLVAKYTGYDIFTSDEKVAFDKALADTKTGLVEMTSAVDTVVKRLHPAKTPTADAALVKAKNVPPAK